MDKINTLLLGTVICDKALTLSSDTHFRAEIKDASHSPPPGSTCMPSHQLIQIFANCIGSTWPLFEYHSI